MKTILCLCLLTPIILASAADAPSKPKPRRPVEMLNVPGSQKGTFVFVNSQKLVPVDEILSSSTADFYKMFKLKFVTTNGVSVTAETARDATKDLKANAAVYIIDNLKLPPLLIAPEEHWAIVNAYALTRDGTEGEKLSRRLKAEIYRAYALLTGAYTSQFEGNIMDAASLRELDRRANDIFIPVDLFAHQQAFLPKLGLEPLKRVTYRTAVKQGWAHQPTNEYEQAIWDYIHFIPTEPIKIKYKKPAGK